MTRTEKTHSPQFKVLVTVEAIRGVKTLSQLGSQFKVHPVQIAKWRNAALEQLPELLSMGGRAKREGEETTTRCIKRSAGGSRTRLVQEVGRQWLFLLWLQVAVNVSSSGCGFEDVCNRPILDGVPQPTRKF